MSTSINSTDKDNIKQQALEQVEKILKEEEDEDLKKKQ